jgi:hypothetical protein
MPAGWRQQAGGSLEKNTASRSKRRMDDSLSLRLLRPAVVAMALASVASASAQEAGPGFGGGPGADGGAFSDGGFGQHDRLGGGHSSFFNPSALLDGGGADTRGVDAVTIPFPTDDRGFGGKTPAEDLSVPAISGFASPKQSAPLARRDGEITLSAKLTDDGAEIPRGLVWRIFSPTENAEGKLPLVASARGGTSTFDLDRGSYLVHASFGRAGATMRVTVGAGEKRQALVLDAGGLQLDAVVSGERRIAADKVRFSIYEAEEDATGERALVIPDVNADAIVRLNAGTYHVVSTYGDVNAVIRSDIRVEAGKLTEATVEHRAAELTLKLVREAGGEAMADTSWSVLTDGGDLVRESVGAYATMVLAEGSYTVVAKNRDRIYQRDVTVTAGDDGEVEVLASEAAAPSIGEISD